MLAGERLVVQPIFKHHLLKVSPIQELDIDLRVELFKPAQLAVFLCNEALGHGGQLDVEVLLWQIEVRAKGFDDIALVIPTKGKGAGFILPENLVKVEDAGKLLLAGVAKDYR